MPRCSRLPSPPIFPGRRRLIPGRSPGALARAAAAVAGESRCGGQVVLVDPDLADPAWPLLVEALGPLSGTAHGSLWCVGPMVPPARHPAAAMSWVAGPVQEMESVDPLSPVPVASVVLPRSAQVPWTVSGATPGDAVDHGLAWLTERDPGLWIAPSIPSSFVDQGLANGFRLIQAGAMTLEGVRPVARHQGPWSPQALASVTLIAQERWPLVLVVDRLPPVVPAGWWVAGSADVHETAQLLVHTLLHGWPVLLVAPSWPAVEFPAQAAPLPAAWIPGSGRWLRPRTVGRPAVVCTVAGVGPVLAGCADHDVGVFQCTSAAPLPEPELRRLGFDGPVLVAEDQEPWAHAIARCIGDPVTACPAMAALVDRWCRRITTAC